MGDLTKALFLSICLSVAFAADTKQIATSWEPLPGGFSKYDPADCKDATWVPVNENDQGCDAYKGELAAECGFYDTKDFKAVEMCCACSGCNVKGVSGDGTTQGTCPEKMGLMCHADGNCGCTVAGEVPVEGVEHDEDDDTCPKDPHVQHCYPGFEGFMFGKGYCD